MNGTAKDWKAWGSSVGLHHRASESIKRHRADSDIGPEEYFDQKTAELFRELHNKTLIYLDTNHWINLCHVVIRSSRLIPAYGEILEMLKTLRKNRRICCPASSSLFQELMRQDDISTREATAKLMDYLSGGVCVLDWFDLIKNEFAVHVHRTIGQGSMDFLPWTKAGFWRGEFLVNFPGLLKEDQELMQKLSFDLLWGLTFEDCQRMPGWEPFPARFAVGWVKTAAEDRRLGSRLNIRALLHERRRQLVSALKDDLMDILPTLCLGIPKEERHIPAIFDPILEGHPRALPFVQIVAGLDAVITFEKMRKIQPNDMWDYFHAAQALPYCDALFCDNFMAQKMRNRPLEFGKSYRTVIGSRPEEIISYLKGLTNLWNCK